MKKKNSSRISVANPDAGRLQGKRVDGLAEVLRLSENEWTRCDVRLKMFVAQDPLTGEFSRASIVRKKKNSYHVLPNYWLLY